jgi:hypothetical protein
MCVQWATSLSSTPSLGLQVRDQAEADMYERDKQWQLHASAQIKAEVERAVAAREAAWERSAAQREAHARAETQAALLDRAVKVCTYRT